MWLVKQLYRWEAFGIKGLPFELKPSNEIGIGCCLIFDSKEDALKSADNQEKLLQEVRFASKGVGENGNTKEP